LTSTYDHRIIQGAESGQFLGRIEASLSGLDSFYTDVFAAMGAALGPALGRPPQQRRPAQLASDATDMADTAPAVSASAQDLAHMAAAMSLVDAYRIYGHLGASLDPLGSEPPGDPALDPAFHGLEQG